MKHKYIINYKNAFYFMVAEVTLLIIMMVGGSMNFLAITENQGRMPFLAEFNYESKSHFSYQVKEEVNYWFFTDIIKISYSYWSIGDFIMILSVVGMFVNSYLMVNSKWKVFKRMDYIEQTKLTEQKIN